MTKSDLVARPMSSTANATRRPHIRSGTRAADHRARPDRQKPSRPRAPPPAPEKAIGGDLVDRAQLLAAAQLGRGQNRLTDAQGSHLEQGSPEVGFVPSTVSRPGVPLGAAGGASAQTAQLGEVVELELKRWVSSRAGGGRFCPTPVSPSISTPYAGDHREQLVSPAAARDLVELSCRQLAVPALRRNCQGCNADPADAGRQPRGRQTRPGARTGPPAATTADLDLPARARVVVAPRRRP